MEKLNYTGACCVVTTESFVVPTQKFASLFAVLLNFSFFLRQMSLATSFISSVTLRQTGRFNNILKFKKAIHKEIRNVSVKCVLSEIFTQKTMIYWWN